MLWRKREFYKYNKIKEYQNCLARVSQINAKINENLDKIKNEGKIKENMQKIKEEIAMVEQENSELLLLEADKHRASLILMLFY